MTTCTKFLLVVVLVFPASTACTFRTSRQDPAKAAASAIDFAKAALVDRDMDRAFHLLDPEIQSNGSKERFIQILMEMNAQGWPKLVTAIEFEPIAGTEGMNIYLRGENEDEKFDFRIPMKGSSENGYKPVGILRGQYPPSKSRQLLPVKLSTER